jgi:hypothetical protein
VALVVGAYDFIGVAAHKIGHALGFGSGADDVDGNVGIKTSSDTYARAKDGSGNVEAAPATGDVSVTVSFSAPAALTASGMDVQNSANQQSYVRYPDLLFSGGRPECVGSRENKGVRNRIRQLQRETIPDTNGVVQANFAFLRP